MKCPICFAKFDDLDYSEPTDFAEIGSTENPPEKFTYYVMAACPHCGLDVCGTGKSKEEARANVPTMWDKHYVSVYNKRLYELVKEFISPDVAVHPSVYILRAKNILDEFDRKGVDLRRTVVSSAPPKSKLTFDQECCLVQSGIIEGEVIEDLNSGEKRIRFPDGKILTRSSYQELMDSLESPFQGPVKKDAGIPNPFRRDL